MFFLEDTTARLCMVSKAPTSIWFVFFIRAAFFFAKIEFSFSANFIAAERAIKGLKRVKRGKWISMEENVHGNRDVVERQESADESNRAILPLLQAPGNLQIPHRVTNFFIDNILRPDFGRKKDGGANREESSLASPESHNSPAAPQTEPVGSTVPTEGTSTPHTVTGAKKPAIAAEEPLKSRGENGDQCLSSDSDSSQASSNPAPSKQPMLWPAWVYCTRYSDRPSSGWWHEFYYSIQ